MMQELSLNVLDIAQNSIKAKSTLTIISIFKSIDEKTLIIKIEDNGCGMTEEQVQHVIDPFYTTRTTRKVGLGVPFFKMSAEMTGGGFEIKSTPNIGTVVTAKYNYEHIDMMPIGDMASTIVSLVSVNPDIDFVYHSKINDKEFTLDTREVRIILEGIPLNSNEVLTFIRDFINENQAEIEKEISLNP